MGKAKVVITRAQVFQRGDGWRFRLKGGNGKIVGNGESYEDRGDAVAACSALCPPELAALLEGAAAERGDINVSV
jgi:hypothetical protein